MQNKDYVSSVADMFGVRASALRFWEKQGLIRFERNEENNYRTPTLSTIEDIWEILFLKSIALSSEQIRRILSADADDIRDILTANEKKLKNEIGKLQTALFKLESKKKMLDKYYALNEKPLEIAETKELYAVPVYETTKEIIRNFLHDESSSGIFCEKGKTPVYALLLSDKDFEEKFRRPPKAKKCVHGLLRVNVYGREKNDSERFYAFAEKNGLRTESITGRYLFAATVDGVRTEFYDAYAFEK